MTVENFMKEKTKCRRISLFAPNIHFPKNLQIFVTVHTTQKFCLLNFVSISFSTTYDGLAIVELFCNSYKM